LFFVFLIVASLTIAASGWLGARIGGACEGGYRRPCPARPDGAPGRAGWSSAGPL